MLLVGRKYFLLGRPFSLASKKILMQPPACRTSKIYFPLKHSLGAEHRDLISSSDKRRMLTHYVFLPINFICVYLNVWTKVFLALCETMSL